MSRIWAIVLNTFREAVRDRILHGVLGLACGVLVFTLALGQLSLDQEQRVVEDIGLAAISFFSVVVAIFLGSSLLYKEIERKTLYVILPKPIRRWQFLVGKFGGIVLTALVFVLLMGGILLLVMALQRGASLTLVLALVLGFPLTLAALWKKLPDPSAATLPLAALFTGAALAIAGAVHVDVLLVSRYLILDLGEVAVLTAVALFFSSFSTPFLTGGFTFGIWLVGRSAQSMAEMRSGLLADEIKTLLHGLARVVPNFDLFVPGRSTLVAAEGGGPWLYVGETMGYAVLYCVVLLVLASAVFARRDFV
jgi:Cu-processing system permease protein